MNQMLAFMLLVIVSMAIGFPLVLFGTERFGDAALSYHDFAERSQIRSGQSIAVTYLCSNNTTGAANVTMVNIGLQDITIFAAMADEKLLCTNGDSSRMCPDGGFKLEYDGAPIGNGAGPFAPEHVANFEVGTNVTDAVRLVTESGKLFKIPMPNVTAMCG